MKIPAFFKTQKFYSLLASILSSAVALLTFSLLARALSKEAFGNWAFFLALYGFFEMALNGLIRTPVIRMAANKTDYNYDEVLSSAWHILIRIALICGPIFFLSFLAVYYWNGDVFYLQLAYWFPLYLFISLPQAMGGWNSNALMRFDRILVIRLVPVVVFLGGVWYMYSGDGNLELIFWFYLGATACASILALVFGWANFRAYLKSKRTYRKEIFNFGKFSMGTTLGSSGLNNSDTFIIMYFLGPEALAMFEIPRRILNLYDIPLRSILQISYPHFSKKIGTLDKGAFRTEFEKVGGFTFLVLLPLAAAIFIFADFLVVLLGGQDYADAAIVLKIFSLYLMITPLDRFSGVILDVLNRPNVNFNKVLVMLSVNIIGDIIAIQLGYGIVGVAAVTTATVVSGIIYGFFMHRKEVPFRPVSLVQNGSSQIATFVRSLF